MGKNSQIEWCDHTFNPWIGCTKVSAGCKNCYAQAMQETRFGVKWGPLGDRRRTSAAYWRQPLKWDREAKWEGVRRRVFCGSLCDVFEGAKTITCDAPMGIVRASRRDLFILISNTPNLDWLLLTKRPGNIIGAIEQSYRDIANSDRRGTAEFFFVDRWLSGYPPPNVWLGASCEDQATADARLDSLLEVPAEVHFVSAEPLLGPIDFNAHDGISLLEYGCRDSCIDWVIVGGESGPNARPMHPDWARSLVRQCCDSRVPVFVKQLGGWPDKLADVAKFPCDLRVREFPAGRLLDGRTWDEIPEEPIPYSPVE